MRALQKEIRQTVSKVPEAVLRKMLAQKVEEAGASMPPEALDSLTKHILSRKEGGFVWDDGSGEDRTVSLAFSAADVKELEDEMARIYGELPSLVDSTTQWASKKLFRSLTLKWGAEHAAQLDELDQFRSDLEDRWGDGLNYLRMLLTSFREMGRNASRRFSRSKAKSYRYRRWVLERLHVRACQVSDEIICLLENGFADGAMARWRTLHEISVAASLIADGDEDLAERYILHDAVEVKRQANDYNESQVPLGARPLGKRQSKSIETDYANVIARFGPTFARPYGWASKHLNQKKPTFKDLQFAAGRADSSSYYKLASFNVHAGARNLFFNLSSIGDDVMLISGRSNAGLSEPGELTAHALALVTSLYADSGSNLDRIMLMNCLLQIRDAVAPSLRKAERQLARDEHALRSDAATTKKKSKSRIFPGART